MISKGTLNWDKRAVKMLDFVEIWANSIPLVEILSSRGSVRDSSRIKSRAPINNRGSPIENGGI